MVSARKAYDARAERERALRELYPLDDDTARLVRACNWDLYNGPLSVDDADALELAPWPGFSRAVREIAASLRSVGDAWITHDACAFRDEPRWGGTCESCEGSGEVRGRECRDCSGIGHGEDPADYYHYERADVIRVLVGRELAPYVT